MRAHTLRWIVALLVAWAFFAATLIAAPTARADLSPLPKSGPGVGLGYLWNNAPGAKTDLGAEKLIAQATAWYGIEGLRGTMHAVAHREAGVYAWHRAWNRSSDAMGVFQHLKRYWSARVRALLKPRWFGRRSWTDANMVSPFNARANVLVAARMFRNQGGACPAWC